MLLSFSSVVVAASLVLGAVPSPTVAFDLKGLDARTYRMLDGLGLERKVVLRLVEDGFAVVAPESRPDIKVRVLPGRRKVSLRGQSVRGVLSRDVALSHGSISEWQLEVAQRVSDLARALRPPLREVPPSRPIGVLSPPTPSASEAPPKELEAARVPAAPPRTFERRWDVGIVAAALLRSGGANPLLLLSARYRLDTLALRMEVGGSVSRGPQLHILEVQAAVGAGFPVKLSRAWELEPGLRVGAVAQHFQVSNAFAQAPSGVNVAPAVWLPVLLRFTATQRLVLTVRAAAGASSPVSHTSEGETLWTRGRFRVECGAGASWTF